MICRLVLALLLLSSPLSALALKAGDAAPAIDALSPEGQPLRLKDLRGSVVYVDFWASWCGPCQEALPVLQRLQTQWSAQGFKVLTVNVDEHRKPALAMIEKLQLKLPVALDPQGIWAERYALPGMPTGYLIGRDGKVRQVLAGYTSKELPALEKQIALALGAKR